MPAPTGTFQPLLAPRERAFPAFLAGRSAGRCSIRRPDAEPPLRARPDRPPRNRETGSASRVADMTSRIRSGRTSCLTSREQGQRHVGMQIPLVKFVDDDGSNRLQERIGQELPGSGCLP